MNRDPLSGTSTEALGTEAVGMEALGVAEATVGDFAEDPTEDQYRAAPDHAKQPKGTLQRTLGKAKQATGSATTTIRTKTSPQRTVLVVAPVVLVLVALGYRSVRRRT